MNEKRFFKVKFGYNTSDQVSIEEKDLEKALYAQITGTPTHLGTMFVNGRNIIAISPHYHKHTGWYDYYEPITGEDWEQIKRDCPSYEGVVEKYKERVSYLISQGKQSLIGKGVEIPELEQPQEEKPKEISEASKILSEKFKLWNNKI